MSESKPEVVFNQYFATRPKLSIILPSGKRIFFVAGAYITDKKDEIAFLDNEVALGHAMIYTKKGQETITSSQLDPMSNLRNKIIAEYEEQRSKQQDHHRDMGSTVKTGVGADVATTKTIASITVGPRK